MFTGAVARPLLLPPDARLRAVLHSTSADASASELRIITVRSPSIHNFNGHRPGAFDPSRRAAGLDRRQFGLQTFGLHVQVVFRLHVHEPLRIDVEEAAEAQRDGRGYALAPAADVVDPAAGDVNGLRQS